MSPTCKSRALNEQVNINRYINKSKRRDIVDVIIPTILVCVLFGPAIPTSSFDFIQLFYTHRFLAQG